MKKTISKKTICLVLALSLMLMLSACAGGGTTESAEAEKPEKQMLIIGTGGVGGSYYPLGGSLAKVWTAKIPNLSVAAQSTGASVENTMLIENGEIELGLTQNDLAEYAVNGTVMFDKKYEKLRLIGRLFSEDIHLFARSDSGIKSITDMRGKRISVSYPGSGANANAEQLLGVFDITVDDIKAEYPSNSDTADRMKDNLLDGMISTTGSPNATFQEMCMSADCDLIGFTDEEIDKIITKYPFFTKKIFPAGTYEGQEEDVQSVCVQSVLAASVDLDEETVYQLTKTLWESQEDLAGMLACMSDLSIDKAFDGITVEYHPGAIRYYKEIGLME